MTNFERAREEYLKNYEKKEKEKINETSNEIDEIILNEKKEAQELDDWFRKKDENGNVIEEDGKYIEEQCRRLDEFHNEGIKSNITSDKEKILNKIEKNNIIKEPSSFEKNSNSTNNYKHSYNDFKEEKYENFKKDKYNIISIIPIILGIVGLLILTSSHGKFEYIFSGILMMLGGILLENTNSKLYNAKEEIWELKKELEKKKL